MIYTDILHSIDNNTISIKEILEWSAANYTKYDEVLQVLTKIHTIYNLNNSNNTNNVIYNDIIVSYLIALNITHNKTIENTKLFEQLSPNKLRRTLVIKGYHMYKEKDYKTAIRLFKEAKYKRGEMLCYIAQKDITNTNIIYNSINNTTNTNNTTTINNICNNINTNNTNICNITDIVLYSFINSKLWSNKNIHKYLLDRKAYSILYRMYNINNSNNINDIKNSDINTNNIEYTIQHILNNINTNTYDSLLSNSKTYIEQLKDIKDKLSYTSEVDYMIGKIYHKLYDSANNTNILDNNSNTNNTNILNNTDINVYYDNACEYYYESYKANKTYIPALYNICRIKGKRVDLHTNIYRIINDYNILYDYINNTNICNTNINNSNINNTNISDYINLYIYINNNKYNAYNEYISILHNNTNKYSLIEIYNNIGIITNNIEYIKKGIELYNISYTNNTNSIVYNDKIKHMEYNIKILEYNINTTTNICNNSNNSNVFDNNINIYNKYITNINNTDIDNTDIYYIHSILYNINNTDIYTTIINILYNMNYTNVLYTNSILSYCYLCMYDITKDIKYITLIYDINNDKNKVSFYSMNILAISYIKHYIHNSDILDNSDNNLYFKYLYKAINIYKQLEKDIKDDANNINSDANNTNIYKISYYTLYLYNNIAITYYLLGNYNIAMKYFINIINKIYKSNSNILYNDNILYNIIFNNNILLECCNKYNTNNSNINIIDKIINYINTYNSNTNDTNILDKFIKVKILWLISVNYDDAVTFANKHNLYKDMEEYFIKKREEDNRKKAKVNDIERDRKKRKIE